MRTENLRIDPVFLKKKHKNPGKDDNINIDSFFELLLSTPWGRESIKRGYIRNLKLCKNSPYILAYFFTILELYKKYVEN